MTRKEALSRVKGYLTDLIPSEEYDEVEEIMKALEQEPCKDAISRQTAIEAFGLSEKSRKYGGDHSGYDTLMKYEIQDILEDLPPVTPQQKTGYWIYDDECHEHGHCSECGYGSIDLVGGEIHNFCSNCGAKMIGLQENEGGNDERSDK